MMAFEEKIPFAIIMDVSYFSWTGMSLVIYDECEEIRIDSTILNTGYIRLGLIMFDLLG